MDVLLVLALLAVPTLSGAVVLAPPLLLWSRGRCPALPVALWATTLALLVGWLEAEYRAGVRADEDGTGGTTFDLDVMIWWYAALALGVMASVGALHVPRRSAGQQ